MADFSALKARADQLVERDWNLPAIETHYQRLAEDGIPHKTLRAQEIVAKKDEILARVQRKGEEYEYLSLNCAKGSALAVMEEFDLGNMELLKGLSPLPGFGMTGSVCGGVAGSIIALGLYFGSDDISDHKSNNSAMNAARRFVSLFTEEVGSILCPEIQEDAIFGKYMDPRASKENAKAFGEANARERCALLPGIGARLAAQVIIESMEAELAG